MSRVHVVKHGTANEYGNFGCRCEPCKRAYAEYQRRYLTSSCPNCGAVVWGRYHPTRLCKKCRAVMQTIPIERLHGTVRGYERGCRCERCTEIASEDRQSRREKNKLPCVFCGQPALNPKDKSDGQKLYPRCRECYMAGLSLKSEEPPQ